MKKSQRVSENGEVGSKRGGTEDDGRGTEGKPEEEI